MELTFQTSGTSTYLTLELQPEQELDSMGLGMLTNNRIPGLAETTFTQLDSTKCVRYNVSSKISASQLFSGSVDRKRLGGVFSGIVNAMISAEEYMLDPESILLDLDYIFTDISTWETVMIYVPLSEKLGDHVDLGAFFKNIIFHAQFNPAENCDYVAKIISYLNSNVTPNLGEFKKILEELSKDVVSPQKQEQTVHPADVQSTPIMVQQAVQPQAATGLDKSEADASADCLQQERIDRIIDATGADTNEKKITFLYLMQHYNAENAAKYKAQKNKKKDKAKVEKSGKADKTTKKATSLTSNGFAVPGVPSNGLHATNQSQNPPISQGDAVISATSKNVSYQQPVAREAINFGETTVLGGNIGETTVLSGPNTMKLNPHLIRIKTSENIPLDKPVFRIGKERSYVDYFVSDNTAISRGHANILNKNDEFYIVDTNSTNHTYIDGNMIPSNEEIRLNDGAKVRLANEEFEFRMR